jgi:hypothetical protein
MNTFLADALVVSGGGNGLIHGLFMILIIGICVGIVWWVGRWVITKLAAPAIAMTIWNGLFILVGAIIIINFLLSLAGHGFITY